MIVIGITGPTGAGKTTALKVLEQLGARVLDCDAIYHRLLEESQPLRQELTGRFGAVFGQHGLDRKKLGKLVWGDRQALDDLNAITHKYIIAQLQQDIAQARKAGLPGVAVDAAGLLESRAAELCDTVVAVVAPEELRLARIMAREGIDQAYARARIQAQKPNEWFTRRCRHTLVNDSTSETFRQKAEALFQRLLCESNRPGGICSMSEQKKLREQLLLNRKNGYDRLSAQELAQMEDYCEQYKSFLRAGRTERECVERAVALAEGEGFHSYTPGERLEAGDKVYWVNREKAIMLAVIGRETLDQGVVIGAAHIDSPRLDLKPCPVVEESELCTLKTHYYGGIRKYQWVSIPLVLVGVVVKGDGTKVKVEIGRDTGDPVLTIPDLLPHLGDKQSKKPLFQGIEGEQLNLLAGSRPYAEDDGSERVKLAVLALLHEKYGITEADLISAELCAIPAFEPADVGLDRSMIGAYGQDDRVCAYAALQAMLELGTPRRTCICMLADKEEVGSMGISGMQSQAFDTFVAHLCDSQGVGVQDCFAHSFCLSADVTAAYDPNFAEVYEKHNAAFLNQGVGLCKYTGSRGKAGASDASAELVGQVRRTLDAAGVLWQMAELGKVDEGGGGTVALYMANRNIDTLDAGTPVLAMHSPFEVTSKLDCYMTYRAMKAIFEA